MGEKTEGCLLGKLKVVDQQINGSGCRPFPQEHPQRLPANSSGIFDECFASEFELHNKEERYFSERTADGCNGFH